MAIAANYMYHGLVPMILLKSGNLSLVKCYYHSHVLGATLPFSACSVEKLGKRTWDKGLLCFASYMYLVEIYTPAQCEVHVYNYLGWLEMVVDNTQNRREMVVISTSIARISAIVRAPCARN